MRIIRSPDASGSSAINQSWLNHSPIASDRRKWRSDFDGRNRLENLSYIGQDIWSDAVRASVLLRRLRRRLRIRWGRVERFISAHDAVKALRSQGFEIAPAMGDFERWQIGDFVMSDADLVQFATTRGLIDAK